MFFCLFFSSSQTVWKGRKEMHTYWNSHCNFSDSGIHLTKKVHCSICFFSFFLSTPKLHWAATLMLDIIGPPGLFLWFCFMFLTEEKKNIYINLLQLCSLLWKPCKVSESYKMSWEKIQSVWRQKLSVYESPPRNGVSCFFHCKDGVPRRSPGLN